MSEETPEEAPVDDVPQEEPPTEEPAVEEAAAEPEEERDPLEVALERAEFAEKEIAYKRLRFKTCGSGSWLKKPKPFSSAAWAWPDVC